MDVVITGASGFVGRNLIQYLDHIGNLSPLKVRYKSNLKLTINSDAVIHLAGKAHDLKNVSRPEEYYEINYELTRKLYDAFLQSNAKKFIYISSVKAVADSVEDILTEQMKPSPATHYGKSKLMAEEFIKAHPLPTEKSFFILRPCMIHGPGNKGNLNLLYKFVSKGIPYPLAAFNNKRSFLSVENLCFVIKEILEGDDIPSGVYNVADDEALSTAEVVKLLSESLSKKPRLMYLPIRFVRTFAWMGDKLKLPLTSERLGKLTENFVVSNEKIKKALGKELPVSARDGILRTARSFAN